MRVMRFRYVPNPSKSIKREILQIVIILTEQDWLKNQVPYFPFIKQYTSILKIEYFSESNEVLESDLVFLPEDKSKTPSLMRVLNTSFVSINFDEGNFLNILDFFQRTR